MTAYLPSAAGSVHGFATSDRADLAPRPPSVIAVEPAVKAKQSYRFDQRFFPLDDGRTVLRLNQPLNLVLNPQTMCFEVQDWGITMPAATVEDLPRQVARRFLAFFSKANHQNLDAAEKLQWLRICDQVDVSQFSVDRASPHYSEGTLKKKSPLTVEWHDGTTEHLPQRLAANFFPLDPGDQFSAFVKMGKRNETLQIERISLIPS